jgi:hypothetical protein
MLRPQQVALAIIVVLLILMAYQFWFKNSEMNTESIRVCGTDCRNYNVHREHHDPEAAAKILQEIVDKNRTLIEHLKSKYLNSGGGSGGFDPEKNNRIDVIHASELYPVASEKMYASALTGIETREYLQERIQQLIKNYSPDKIYEISPNNSQGVTSYAEDKRTLILCLRNKTPDANGVYELHAINDLFYVVLHELAHVMNDKFQHTEESGFWPLFKFLLINATECGIYTPVDYSKHPMVYCGLDLTYNPYYDKRL